MNTTSTTRQPTLFIPHGAGPCFFMDWDPAGTWDGMADIPVVQLSLRRDLDPATHLSAGHALAGLRREGVLIVASGMSFHNMRGYGDPAFGPVSDRFDAWLGEAVESPAAERKRRLCDWASAPEARACHPHGGEEHFIPLLVAAGAADGDAGQRVYTERVMETTLSAFRFG